MALKFCSDCKNMLYMKEIDIADVRTLVHSCKHCKTDVICDNLKIESKEYRTTNTLDTSHLNKYKVNDPTLQTRKTKCPKCKKINVNPFEVKYHHNSYNVKCICKNCHNDWYL